MRKRMNKKIDIQKFVQESNEKYARREAIIESALHSIVKEKKVRYKEAKRILSNSLKISVMFRLIADVV